MALTTKGIRFSQTTADCSPHCVSTRTDGGRQSGINTPRALLGRSLGRRRLTSIVADPINGPFSLPPPFVQSIDLSSVVVTAGARGTCSGAARRRRRRQQAGRVWCGVGHSARLNRLHSSFLPSDSEKEGLSMEGLVTYLVLIYVWNALI